MARFDVYRHLDARRDAPYIIDLQSESVSALLKTRIVAPLRPLSDLLPGSRLFPKVTVEARELVISMPELASIPAARLGQRVASLTQHHFEIVSALDFVFQGY